MSGVVWKRSLFHTLRFLSFFLNKIEMSKIQYEQQSRDLFAVVLATSLSHLYFFSFTHGTDLGGVE